MTKNRDDKWFEELKEKHPELLSHTHYAAVGAGWSKLITDLCYKIDKHKKRLPEQSPEEQVVVAQIKEKFGGLRFYVYGGDDYIQGMIDLAECISYSICEDCSQPGKPRREGWVRTLCDACFEEEDNE